MDGTALEEQKDTRALEFNGSLVFTLDFSMLTNTSEPISHCFAIWFSSHQLKSRNRITIFISDYEHFGVLVMRFTLSILRFVSVISLNELLILLVSVEKLE